MSQSIEQVKRKSGRPPKHGDIAMGGAARSKEYRDREAVKASSHKEELRYLASVFARVVAATTQRGAMDPEVLKIVTGSPSVAKYLHYSLTTENNALPNTKKLVKTLKDISMAAHQLDLEEYIARKV